MDEVKVKGVLAEQHRTKNVLEQIVRHGLRGTAVNRRPHPALHKGDWTKDDVQNKNQIAQQLGTEWYWVTQPCMRGMAKLTCFKRIIVVIHSVCGVVREFSSDQKRHHVYPIPLCGIFRMGTG